MATPGTLVATTDALWLSFGSGLWRVDPSTNRVTKTFTLGLGPDFLAFAFNSLWATNFDAQLVLRIDPASGQVVARIPTPHPQGIVATNEGVWVANHHEGTVTLIDPATNRSNGLVSVGPTGPNGPQGMAVIDGKVWVGMLNASQVVAFDPATRKVVSAVAHVPAPCGNMAASGTQLWISECLEQKSVDQIDMAAGRLMRSLWVDAYAGTPIPVADGIWLPLTSARFLKLSDETGQPIEAVSLPSDCAAPDVSASTVAFGSIWVVCERSLLRFDPSDLP